MREKTVEFKVSEEQHEFLTSTAPSTGFVAGVGSGKSMIASLKILLFKMKHPTIDAAYYLPSYPLVRDIAFKKFPKMCQDLGIKYTLNKSDKELKLKGFGKIIFRTMSDPESIVGYDVGYSVVDETDNLSLEKMTTAYQNIVARNRTVLSGSEINIVDAVGTPEGYKWFYKNFKQNPIKGSKLIKASTYSNLHNLPSNYIETLSLIYPPNRLKAYLMGDFVNLTSLAVYSYFDRKKHHTNEEIKRGEYLHIGQDFNIGGCVSTVNVIRNGFPMLLEEFTSHDTQGIAVNLKKRYPDHDITIYPDASGGASKTNASETDISILRSAGYRINSPSQNGRVTDRVNSYNLLLSENNFKVNTHNCPKSTEALEQQAYDKNSEPEKFNTPASIDDFNDAQGYFIVRKYGIIVNKMTISKSSFK